MGCHWIQATSLETSTSTASHQLLLKSWPMLPTGRLLSGFLDPQSSAAQWCSLESCWTSSSWCLKVSSLCAVLGTRKVLSLCEILHFLCVNTFCRHAGIGAGVCPWRKDGCLLFFWSHLPVFHWAHPHCGQEHGPRRHYYSVTHRHHHLSIHSLSWQAFFVCLFSVGCPKSQDMLHMLSNTQTIHFSLPN